MKIYKVDPSATLGMTWKIKVDSSAMLGMTRRKASLGMTHKKGFTFLEMIITIAIISIMTAVFLGSLSGNKDLKAVEGEARKLAAAIREAQNYALTGKNVVGQTNPICGWGIMFNNGMSPNRYIVFYNYDSVSKDCSQFNLAVANRKYESTMTFSQNYNRYLLENKIKINSAPTSILYTIPFGSAYDEDGNDLADASAPGYLGKILLESQNDNTKQYTICVYNSGRVTEKQGDNACSAM